MNNRLPQSLRFAARQSRRGQQWFTRLEHVAGKLIAASRRKRYTRTSVADWLCLRVRVSRVFAVTLPSFVFAACNAERTSEPTDVVGRANAVAGLGASEFSDRLARGFAVALRDSLVRTRLHDALRNSPFPYQAIAFQPYLAGRSGSSLLRAIALEMEMSASQLSDSLSTRPLLTLAMTALTDRIRWTGDLDVAVAVSAEQGLKRSEVLTAYSPELKAFRLTPTMEHRPLPTILVANAPIDFGGDPEAVRSRVPARRKSASWHGVATPGGGIGSSFVTCDDEPTQDYCDEPSSGPGGSSGPLWAASSLCSPYTFSAVTGSNDADTDGIKDECEVELAQAFEPEILFEAQEIHHWREPHFIVENFGGLTQIGYLLSYYYDGGQFSHNGDSEMIIVRVRPSGNAWELVNITTTAHYGVTWIGMDETRTYGWQDYFFFAGSVKARIYASRSHHANYNTPWRCNQRIGDICSSAPSDGGFSEFAGRGFGGVSGIRHDNNIGNNRTPLVIDPFNRFGSVPGIKSDCTYADNPARTGVECYVSIGGGYSQGGVVPPWAPTFAGWSGSAGTTPYPEVIRSVGFFFYQMRAGQ